jgi:hypothetical protein
MEHVTSMGEMRKTSKILVEKPEGKRPRRMWADMLKNGNGFQRNRMEECKLYWNGLE